MMCLVQSDLLPTRVQELTSWQKTLSAKKDVISSLEELNRYQIGHNP
jgi:hypothetical protein